MTRSGDFHSYAVIALRCSRDVGDAVAAGLDAGRTDLLEALAALLPASAALRDAVRVARGRRTTVPAPPGDDDDGGHAA